MKKEYIQPSMTVIELRTAPMMIVTSANGEDWEWQDEMDEPGR